MKMLLYEKRTKGIAFTCCRLRIITPVRSDGAGGNAWSLRIVQIYMIVKLC